MRIVFMGTPEFAVPSLRALLDNGYEVVGAITQPDRPAGRGHKLTPCPVKLLAQERGVPVYQFEKIKNQEGVDCLRALKPDLVIAWRGGNAERQVDQLASLGIKVMWVDATSIEQIANALRQLAPWSPQPDKAEQAAQSLLDQYAQLKAQYADKPKKRVFLQFGINPPFTSGKESIQNQVLEVCGGENIFKDSRVPWPQVSREQVLARSPQAIVITGGPDQIPKIKQYWGEQLKIPVIPLTSDWFERASPRIILAAQQLCNALSQVD